MKKPARKILFGNNFTIVFKFPTKSRLCLCVGGDTLIEATRAKKMFDNNIGANEKVISLHIAYLHGRIHGLIHKVQLYYTLQVPTYVIRDHALPPYSAVLSPELHPSPLRSSNHRRSLDFFLLQFII